MLKIRWIELNLVIEVEEEDVAGRQRKFYGKCIESEDPFWLNQYVETPFLYKSGWEIVRK